VNASTHKHTFSKVWSKLEPIYSLVAPVVTPVLDFLGGAWTWFGNMIGDTTTVTL
jgi:hypothetical protein